MKKLNINLFLCICVNVLIGIAVCNSCEVPEQPSYETKFDETAVTKIADDPSNGIFEFRDTDGCEYILYTSYGDGAAMLHKSKCDNHE